jgi:phosphohistidine phosphatase
MREVQDDLDRALTPKGERQAQRLAGWLNRQLPATTRVLVSPARRAQQTALPLERKFKTVPALAPDGGVEGLLHAVRWPDAREPVLVVGHQPTLGLAAAYLLAGQPQTWVVRKGAVWWLRAREREGELQVVLHAVVSPELV